MLESVKHTKSVWKIPVWFLYPKKRGKNEIQQRNKRNIGRTLSVKTAKTLQLNPSATLSHSTLHSQPPVLSLLCSPHESSCLVRRRLLHLLPSLFHVRQSLPHVDGHLWAQTPDEDAAEKERWGWDQVSVQFIGTNSHCRDKQEPFCLYQRDTCRNSFTETQSHHKPHDKRVKPACQRLPVSESNCRDIHTDSFLILYLFWLSDQLLKEMP